MMKLYQLVNDDGSINESVFSSSFAEAKRHFAIKFSGKFVMNYTGADKEIKKVHVYL